MFSCGYGGLNGAFTRTTFPGKKAGTGKASGMVGNIVDPSLLPLETVTIIMLQSAPMY